MNNISKRFEQIVVSTQRKFLSQGTILPVKTEDGILVGSALIKCNGSYKNIYKHDELMFENICLNKVAIKLANLVAWSASNFKMKELYRADQIYNKLYIDTKVYHLNYNAAIKNKDQFKAEVLWTRYQECKIKAKYAREKAERLASF